MGDWLDELSGEERGQWDAFIAAFRRDALRKLAESDAFLSLAPPPGKINVKFCVELGAAIMLDKPIVVIVMPGRTVPPMLDQIASHVIHADIDTEEGRRETAAELARLTQAEQP